MLHSFTYLADACLHGISQIYFQVSAWCGALILAGMAVADWKMAAFTVVGLVAATATALALRLNADEIRTGLHGFCGALAGAAAYIVVAGPWALGAAIISGIACVPVALGLARLFAVRPLAQFRLPTTTGPFCLVAVILFYATSAVHYPVAELPEPESDLLGAVHTILVGISQVVLVNNVWAGLLILIGLFIASRRVGVAALLGALVASGLAESIGDRAEDYNGLDSYSAVLAAIAMAAVFLRGRMWPWVFAVIGSGVALLLETVLRPTGVPLFTWPYVLTAWLLLIVVRWMPSVSRADAEEPAREELVG